MDYSTFKNTLCKAIRAFLIEEETLFTTYNESLREEGISHQLACKISQLFKPYNVDCEYSKQPGGNDKKNSDGDTVRPDIIIHKRGPNTDNLAVIEVKWGSNKGNDDEKVSKYRNQNYTFGVVIRFGKKGIVEHLAVFDFARNEWFPLVTHEEILKTA